MRAAGCRDGCNGCCIRLPDGCSCYTDAVGRGVADTGAVGRGVVVRRHRRWRCPDGNLLFHNGFVRLKHFGQHCWGSDRYAVSWAFVRLTPWFVKYNNYRYLPRGGGETICAVYIMCIGSRCLVFTLSTTKITARFDICKKNRFAPGKTNVNRYRSAIYDNENRLNIEK